LAVRPALGLAIGLTLLAAAASAHHAELIRSEPPKGAQLTEAPRELRAWFNAPLVVPGSGLAVTDERDQRVEQGSARLEAGDATQLVVGLPALAPGSYRVTWRVTAATDQDFNQGDFTFAVVGDPGRALLDRLRGAGLLALGLGLLTWGVLREAGRQD
jgi:methionine-rich copper-binding protein CopC